MEPWRSKETLVELYHDEGLSQREVADRLGCSVGTVHRWMEKHSIETETAYQDRPPAHYFNGGYEFVATEVDGETKYVQIHRLVAVAKFGFSAVCGMEVHHKNEWKMDNRPTNLELCTPGDHRVKHNNFGTLQ